MEEQDTKVGGIMTKPNSNSPQYSPSVGSTSSSQNKRSRAIRWDEETIALHDQERGTRQKIDEPPTPYRYSSESDVESGSEKDGSVFGSSPPSAGVMSEWSNLHAKLNYERHLQMQQDEQRDVTEMGLVNESEEGMNVNEPIESASFGQKNIVNDNGNSPLKPSLVHNPLEHHLHHGQHHVFILGEADTRPEHDKSHNEFVNKRSKHYNEFKVLKALREKHSDTDDDDQQPLKSAIFHHDHHNPHHVQVSEDVESEESEKEENEENEDKKKAHNEFVNKRASHYNEFLVIKAMRQQMEKEEDEEEDDENGDNNNNNNNNNYDNNNPMNINNVSEKCESDMKRLSIGDEIAA